MAHTSKKKMQIMDFMISIVGGTVIAGLFAWAIPEAGFLVVAGVWVVACLFFAAAGVQSRERRGAAYDD